MEEEKEFTQGDMKKELRFAELIAENRLLKQILEQKLEIELSPKRDLNF